MPERIKLRDYHNWIAGNTGLDEDPAYQITEREIELYVKAGMSLDDTLEIQEDDWDSLPDSSDCRYCLRVYTDDLTTVLFLDRKPIAGFYMSSRGAYQAWGYLVAGGKFYFATDVPAVITCDGLSTNTWGEIRGGDRNLAYAAICGRLDIPVQADPPFVTQEQE